MQTKNVLTKLIYTTKKTIPSLLLICAVILMTTGITYAQDPFYVSPDGNLGINSTNPRAEIHLGERLTLSSPTQTQTGWIGSNVYFDNGAHKRVRYGGAADMSFDYGGSITFKTAMYGTPNSTIDDFRYNMKLPNTGGVIVDEELTIASLTEDLTKSTITRQAIFRNQVHPVETDYEYFSLQVNSKSAPGINLDPLGRLIVGTNDPCLLIGSGNSFSAKLGVAGGAMKTGDPFWEGTSDRRLKKNIAPMEESLSKFMEVPLYGYEYKKSGEFRYGIMAQEMQDVFPHSVGTAGKSGEEYLTFNPNNLIFTSMKATQEIGKLVLEQEEQINTLEEENQRLRAELEAERDRNNEQESRLDNIEARLANLNNTNTTETSPRDANSTVHINAPDIPQLQQNIPNPFQQSTTIPYYLPEYTQSATLLIHDMAGKTIATHTLPVQKGAGTIDVKVEDSQSKGGALTYTLYINDRPVSTKQMILLSK